MTIRLALAGIGNCASSLEQGLTYYRDADPADEVPGLMHVVLGGHHIRDIEVVAAFDVDAGKVKKHQHPSNRIFFIFTGGCALAATMFVGLLVSGQIEGERIARPIEHKAKTVSLR